MPSNRVSDETYLKTLRTLAACGGNKTETSKILGFRSKSTVFDHIRAAESRGLTAASVPFDPEAKDQIIEGLRAELSAARDALRSASKPHFTVRQDNAGRSSKIRLVCIGDAHDAPAIPDKSRFEWMGRYINETKPDIVVQIGDFATLDSLSTHTPNESFAGKSKPTFMADMVSFNLALEAMQIEGTEKHCTLGNHERRLYLFEDRAPEAYGMMQCELQKIFERHKWTCSPYGQITYYGGVGFVHAAINKLGKTYGGKNAEGGAIANDSVHDLVIGHSHVERRHRAPKIGGNNYVQIINVGCALPDGHIEEYALHAITGWSYGLADMVIQNGSVTDYHFVSMASMKEKYGKN